MAITKYEQDGKFYFLVDYRLNGVRSRRGGFRTKRDAESFLELELNKTNSVATSGPVLIGDAIEKYKDVISSGKSDLLQKLEGEWFRKLSIYLRKVRKRKWLHDVDTLDLKSYQADLAKHVTNGTVNRRFDSIKSFFNECVDWQLLMFNPGEKVKKLPHKSVRRKTWRLEEIRKVHEALPDHYARLFYFIAVTGCRPGEARTLCWCDVDVEGQIVKLKSTKGGQGEMIREFPLTGSFKTFMKNHFITQRKAFLAKKSDIVFPSRDGREFDPTSLQKRVKKLVKKIGLHENLCVYGLRHTFTTRLIEKDVNLEKVRLLVGHEKITTTQGYAHVNKKSLEKAASEYDLREELA